MTCTENSKKKSWKGENDLGGKSWPRILRYLNFKINFNLKIHLIINFKFRFNLSNKIINLKKSAI